MILRASGVRGSPENPANERRVAMKWVSRRSKARGVQYHLVHEMRGR
ncbi:hypothetical protein LCGC14_2422850, partial [marine sediment metagenome]